MSGMSDTSNDMDGASVDGLSMYRLIDFDNLPQIHDSSDRDVSETIFEGESVAGICMLSSDYSVDAVENYSEKNEAKQTVNGQACANKNSNSDEFTFKADDEMQSIHASHKWDDLSDCQDPNAHPQRSSGGGKEPDSTSDVGFASSSSSSTVSQSQSHSESMSIKTEDDSPDSVRLLSVQRLSGADSDDRNCYGSSSMLCEPLESSELYDNSAATSSDSSRKSLSNFFDTEDEDSEPFGSYVVNANEIGEDDPNRRSTSQGNDEEEAGDLPIQQRIRRKRLYRFSSSSSEDEHSELSISSSNRSSSKSGDSSSPKVCKLDENTCTTAAKDHWRQVSDIFGRQLGRRTVTMPDVNFQRRVGGSLGMAQRLELYTKYERHKGCVNALNFNDSGICYFRAYSFFQCYSICKSVPHAFVFS